MKINLAALLFVFSINCHAQTPNTTPGAEYANETYQIRYPITWQLDTTRTMGADLFLFSPLEDESDKFRENVNVIIQNLAGLNIDLEKYKQISDEQLEKMGPDVKVFESTINRAEGGLYYKIAYEMAQGELRLRISSKCMIKNDVAYLATFTSEIANYDRYKIIGESILNTFYLKK